MCHCVTLLIEADGVGGWSDTQHLAKESHEIRNNIILPRRKLKIHYIANFKMAIITCTVINTVRNNLCIPIKNIMVQYGEECYAHHTYNIMLNCSESLAYPNHGLLPCINPAAHNEKLVRQ